MMFNTYDIENGIEQKETQQYQHKKNRGDTTNQHTLMMVEPT